MRSSRFAGPETQLQQQALQLIPVIAPGTFVKALPKPHYRSSSSGWPDLFCSYEGRVIMLELKVKGGRVKEHQSEIHKALSDTGIPVIICWNIEDVEAAVKFWYAWKR